MKILISGPSGLVGTTLIPTLIAKNHKVFKLVRKPSKSADEIQWDAEKGFNDTEQTKLEGFDAVIHLAGDNIASENWSKAKKKIMVESRVQGTRLLVEALKKCQDPPKIFISASAEGFYGRSTGDTILTEDSPKGVGFLADLCSNWEIEAQKAESFARVVRLRISVVLSKGGGAIEKLLTPFKLGVGGALGSGKQWFPWITIDDLIGVFHFALENEISGAFNTTSPNPVTNYEFTKTLGKVLHRPTILSVPEFAVKLMFGEMGENLLLKGCRVVPKRLEELGYKFKFENLEEALVHVLA
ncbi:MAG TPA: TIGR01777 family oxidoreductase [Pyrinomonadaceae bacterium]|nr:TIGR01777 family oxidoreductase [Pyrinomonadaceae bacterium]